MSKEESTQHFRRMAPTIIVSDIATSVAFFVDILGFINTFENGSPVGFVILKRDDVELHLTWNRGHKASDSNVAHLLVDNATDLHDHLEAHGVRITKGVRDADYGLRGFVFADPDGNQIDVGQRLES